MCFKKKKSNINIVLYMVTNSPILLTNSPLTIFTITQTKTQAQEYLNKKIVLDNKEHFDFWCGLHNKDPHSKETWFDYALNVVNYKDYYILETAYTIKDIAQIFRTMKGCVPIGCSFDEPIELVRMLNNLSESTLDKLEQMIAEAVKKNEDKSLL